MKNKKFKNQLKNEIIKIDKIDFNDEVLRRIRIPKKQKVSFEKEILIFFVIAAVLVFSIDLNILKINQTSILCTITLICLMPILMIFFKIVYNKAIKKY